MVVLCLVFFFKQKTAYEMRISDWSSDVCSSDLDRAAAVAGRTRLAQDVPERFAGALARHLDQAERRERMDLRAGVIGCQRTFQRTQRLGTMILGFHVDEIENDDAAEITQSQQIGRAHV